MANVTINGNEVLASGVVLLYLGSEIRVETRLGPVTIHSAHRDGGVGTDGKGGYVAHLASGETFKESGVGLPEGKITFLRQIDRLEGANLARLTYTITFEAE